ncbi:hypothetical protein EV383_4009 [Pseudonocardia sediminis]|uniref:Uncharacterized protein n=2 Tax=Pseudonocardia sediminis TaxID=1397368 RepID=A0A4Q7UYG3_PSEST|nr:hypothetical protein EV383_4009 [Pseudonocardia sediminis]
MHQSVTSSVIVSNNDAPVQQVDVSTHQFFGLGGTSTVIESTPTPQVWLRAHKTDGLDLTIIEARQLAQVLINHADLAAGAAADPIDRAATLITSMLGHTGRDVHQLHDALVRWIDVMVEAMASAR